MRTPVQFAMIIATLAILAACDKTEQKDVKPAFDIAPQRAQLQQAKDLEKKMAQDAEEQRKVIEAQTNPH